jgi:hypothetical protein
MLFFAFFFCGFRLVIHDAIPFPVLGGAGAVRSVCALAR